MATEAITGSDLTNLRAGSQEIDALALHITPLDTVAIATVTTVPTLSPYVSLGVTWSSGQSDVSIGQYFVITDGSGNRVSSGVIRKIPTSGTVFINTTPLGSNFYAIDIEQAIEVGDTVTVYSHRPLAGLKSRIAGDRTFNKSWDIGYTDENENPPPVANLGTWQAAQIGVGSSASFRLPRVGNNTSFAFDTTISTYAWSLPTGVTLKAGYALSDSVIKVDAVAGRHLVSLTVTDANTKTHTGYVWLFVSDGSTGASLSERYSVTIGSDDQTPEGRTLSVTITGDNLKNVLYPGAGILLREWPVYNGSSLTDGVIVDTFVGYVGDLQINTDGNINTAVLTIESPFIYAARVSQPSQVVQENASPSNWTQATSKLTNPRGFAYYAIKWHSPALLDMHDLDLPYSTPRRQSAEWQAGTLQSALQTTTEYIYGSIGSASDGATVQRKKPVYLSNSARNALDTVMTLQTQDLQAPLGYTRRFNQALSEARTGAFAYDGTSVKAWLAAKRWGQGQGNATLPNFTVTISEGLSTILDIVGHFYAEQSREIGEITAILTANQDVVDPAYWLWVGITVSSALDAWGDGFTSKRTLCTNISREWVNDANGIRKVITYGLQPETFGQPGEEIPIQNAAAFQLNGYSLAIPTNFLPDNDDVPFGGAPVLIALNETGELAITYDYTASNPEYGLVNTFINDQTVNDFSIDYNSPYFQNGNNPSYALGLYAVVTSSDQIRVWYFADILSNTSATAVAQVSMADSSVTTNARIEVSETTPTLVLVTWKDQTGTQFIRSTDGGATWSSVTRIGDSITDTDNDNAPLGADVDGVNQLVSAPNASSEYGLYLATTAGGSFSRLSNTEISTIPFPLVKIVPETDDAYTSTAGRSGSDTVTFTGTETILTRIGDGAVEPAHPHIYIRYDIVENWEPDVTTSSSLGNPTDCVVFQPTTGTSTGRYIFLDYALFETTDPTNTMNNFGFDYYIDSDISTTELQVAIKNSAGTQVEFTTGLSLTAGSWQSWDYQTVIGNVLPLTVGGNYVNNWQVRVFFVSDGSVDATATTIDIRLDNVFVDLTTPLGGGSAPTLQKVTDFDGTDAWTDVSPVSEQAPQRPHDLAIDIADVTVLNTYTPDNTTHYRSTNGASSWSAIDASAADQRVWYTASGARIRAGTTNIELSLDGSTYSDKTGNLGTIFPSGYVIKRIQPL